MSKSPKFSPMQRMEAESRVYSGESIRQTSRAMGIPESTVRNWCANKHNQIKVIADQLVTAERNVRALPAVAQVRVRSMVELMLMMTNSLMAAGASQAQVAERLSTRAAARSVDIDHPDEARAAKALIDVHNLSKTADIAATLPMGIARAHQDAAAKLMRSAEEEGKARETKDLTDDELAEEAKKYGIDYKP